MKHISKVICIFFYSDFTYLQDFSNINKKFYNNTKIIQKIMFNVIDRVCLTTEKMCSNTFKIRI